MRSSTTNSAWIWGVAALVAATPPAGAQALPERVGEVGDGVVRMSFAARAGVCGSGSRMRITSRRYHIGDWESDCEPGPVRVAIHRRQGRTVDVKMYIGGSWRAAARAVDLGAVAAREAAAYLLALSGDVPVDATKEAITAASVADSASVWPELAGIARDDSRRTEVRRHAVFWLSQLEGDAALEQLLDLARNERDREVRKRAIFWLGQSADPRAIAFLKELIIG